MRHLALLIALAVAAGLFAPPAPAAADDGKRMFSPEDKEVYDAWAAGIEKSLKSWDYHNTAWKEDIGWLASPMIRGLARGYAVSGETRWLDHLIDKVDVLMGRLKEEPIPSSESKKAFPGWGHRITGEALLLEGILEFIEQAQNDKNMPEKYRKKADEYLAIIDPALIMKWDEAGNWHNTHLNCGTYTEGITLPHNKNAHLGSMLLVAARVTKDEGRRLVYLEKAARLARRWHKFLKLDDGGKGYIWHYWDAAGRWDYDEKGKIRHWVGLEHRGYASSDTGFVAAAYNHGLVFDRVDLERHVHTFLTKIWNGDEENPKYRALGWFNEKYVNCTLLSALAPYNEQIMKLWTASVKQNPTSWGNIVGVPSYLLARQRGMGYKRHHEEFGRMIGEAAKKQVPEDVKSAD